MTLDEQIAQMTDPNEFTRLCNAVLTSQYGTNYQIIDGTRGDSGNDGYIISEKRLTAMYCPVKPERRTDADYLSKIKSDMAKAQALRDSGKYEIEEWTFLTPRKLSNETIVAMRAHAKTIGFNATHLESTYLATEMLRHRHLLEVFPSLHINEVGAKLDEILQLLKTQKLKEIQIDGEMNDYRTYSGPAKDVEANTRVVEIRKALKTEKTKPELKSIYYKTSDFVVKLNAILGLLDFYDPVEDATDDIVRLCNEGLAIAEHLGAISLRSHILAQKGYMLSYSYAELDMRTSHQIMTDNIVGFQTITEDYRQKVVARLTDLEQQFDSAFAEAVNISKDSHDYLALAGALIFIGNAAGQRALYLQTLNRPEGAAEERATCRRALMTAKDISTALGDELGAANALYNLANQIRFFGETAEAMELTAGAMEVARKFNDQRLSQRAQWLIDTLETGKIPDYLAGERRV